MYPNNKYFCLLVHAIYFQEYGNFIQQKLKFLLQYQGGSTFSGEEFEVGEVRYNIIFSNNHSIESPKILYALPLSNRWSISIVGLAAVATIIS